MDIPEYSLYATRLIATHTGMAILNISSFILRQITAIRH